MPTKSSKSGDTATPHDALKGIQVLKRFSRDGKTLLRIEYRHRATGEKIEGEPSSPSFIAKRAELDGRCGKPQQTEVAGTLADLVRQYLTSREYDNHAKSTKHRENNARMLRCLMKATVLDEKTGKSSPAFGTLPKDAVLADTFFDWMYSHRDAVADEHPRSADMLMVSLIAVFNWAVERRKLKFNPLGKYKKIGDKMRAEAIWTEAQWKRWLDVAGQDAYKGRDLQLVFCLALTLGQRAGDLRRLTWKQYGSDQQTKRKGFLIKQSKTGAKNGYIFVPVLPFVQRILDAAQGEPDACIMTLRGKPWTEYTLSHYFRRVTVAAGIQAADGSSLHMHDLRGTCITLLARHCTERQIAAISGHNPSYISVILKRYVATDTRVAAIAIDHLDSMPEMRDLERATESLLLPAPLLIEGSVAA